jgi:hypothetical protein
MRAATPFLLRLPGMVCRCLAGDGADRACGGMLHPQARLNTPRTESGKYLASTTSTGIRGSLAHVLLCRKQTLTRVAALMATSRSSMCSYAQLAVCVEWQIFLALARRPRCVLAVSVGRALEFLVLARGSSVNDKLGVLTLPVACNRCFIRGAQNLNN